MIYAIRINDYITFDMDITKIFNHSVELLKLRGEDTKSFEEQFTETYGKSSTVTQPLSTANFTLFYVFNEKSFKDLWASIKTLTVEEMEQLYNTKKFIMILFEYPPSITLQAIHNKNTEMLKKDGALQVFLMKELMFNPTKHELVPKHKKLTDIEIKQMMEELQLKSKTQLPFIQKTDVIARWLGLQRDDVVRITRYSETSGKYYFYRCCV